MTSPELISLRVHVKIKTRIKLERFIYIYSSWFYIGFIITTNFPSTLTSISRFWQVACFVPED